MFVAIIKSVLWNLFFVLSLYLHPASWNSKTYNRNQPRNILIRSCCGFSAVGLVVLTSEHSLTWLGLTPISSIILTGIHAAFSLVLLSLSSASSTAPRSTYPLIRDVLLAPLLEEILRVLTLNELSTHMAQLPTVLIASFLFGLSHLHKDLINLFPLELEFLLEDLFRIFLNQFTIPFIFGLVTSYTYLLTDSLLAPLVTHVLCNALGPPDLSQLKGNIRLTCLLAIQLILAVLFLWRIWNT